jgi:hypothetical protein
MRDLVVREGLGAMAQDAADRLRDLVASGNDLPYEVREPGDGSPLCRYEPLTERFVRDHATELRDLESFGAACAALEAADLAGPYLEQMGVAAPDEPRRRAELAAVVFLCRLWIGSSDFSLDHERLELAIEEVEVGGETSVGEIEVIVPLRGFQMPLSRLELASAAIVRADTVDVPAEAQAGDARGASPWEPAFLAVARVAEDPEQPDADPGAAAVEAFRNLVSTLRLFKAGGVGLGPHAWTRISGDRWRRIATGAGRPRPGGYRLADTELSELTAFSRALAERTASLSRPERSVFPSALVRALSRFEAGLERNVVIEALNDHLLSLRFVLEGGGPADLGLSMRVAALCAEPEHRAEVKAVVDRALGLERQLWSGEPAPGSGDATPAETAGRLEELARAILKDAACGHLGSDLRTTADEILLADGLAVGDGAVEQRGSTAEWDVGAGEEPGVEIELEGELFEDQGSGAPERTEPELIDELDRLHAAMQVSRLDERISPEPSADPEEEQMSLAARNEPMGPAEPERPEVEPARFDEGPEPERSEPEPARSRPVEVLAGSDPSPVTRLIEQTRAERRARHERVADLFPAPETTEWNVREIAYDRRRRASIRPVTHAS